MTSDYISKRYVDLIVNRTIPSDLGDIGIWQPENRKDRSRSEVVRDFPSGAEMLRPHINNLIVMWKISWYDGIGRHGGLKIPWY